MSRLLVVDDEEGVLFTLVANLELEGFEVASASNALEALAMLETTRFDLVLSDVRMPGMNGVEMFRRIRASKLDVPVVLMTGFALEAQLDTAMREGAFAVLPKLLPVDRLLTIVARALERPVVLVVDDVASVAESTAVALSELGVPARAASDADEALRCLAESAVDVCVVDLVMGEVDGAETIRRILDHDARVICIAVTGENVPKLMQRAAVSAYALLRKPVPPSDLCATIARARSSVALRPVA